MTPSQPPGQRPHFSEKVVVVGGGIVGVCCALYLQREGYKVTLIDPAQAGDSTAKWSCGQMAIGEVIPLSRPGVMQKIPGWLLDQKGPLALRANALPGMLPWFLRFLACARQSKTVEIAEDMASLTRHAHADYAVLLRACPNKVLMSERPVIKVFESRSGLEQERPLMAFRKTLGFKAEVLDHADISALEPALSGKFSHGLLFPDWKSVSDTEGFITALTQSFIDQGGVRVRGQVKKLDEVADGVSGVTLTNGERFGASHVVIAAGVESRHFFDQLGVRIPLAGIAGYQVLLPNPGVEVRHSVIFPDGGFCFSPMTRGLQIGGTMEFAKVNAEPDFKRADIILEKARKILPVLQLDDIQYAVGYRPYLPDTKPVIDRSARLTNVFMAFGHGQLGLTLGATTGRLIAQMVCGVTPGQNLAAFSAKRFDLLGVHAWR